MTNLLLTGAFKYRQEQIDALESLGYSIQFIQDEREEMDMDPSHIHAVICNGLFLYNDIEKFKNLKFIQVTSAGLDRLPMDYIRKKGIQVFNAGDVYSIPMAEWAVLKVLELYKGSPNFYASQRDKRWEKQRDLLELTDKTALIIGYGNTGREIAQRLQAFGTKLIGVSRSKKESPYLHEHLSIDQIDEGIKRADIIFLTLPLNKATYHIIDKEKMALMKDQAVLINIGRGGLIHEEELIKALTRGKFLGVALDVFEKEPLGDSPLWDFENVIITPHNSFVSDKINERLFHLMMENLRKWKI